MTSHLVPLVGAHFRPPAKALLAHLPTGAQLMLRPEPDNQFDSNAVAVLVNPAQVPKSQHRELENDALSYGFDLEEILSRAEWHLGYVKATKASWLQSKIIGDDDCPAIDYPAMLAFDPSGKPLCMVEI
jgi:hypothetical protein